VPSDIGHGGGGGQSLEGPFLPHPRPPHAQIFFIMDSDFDLFGNPIGLSAKQRGRPEHEPTQENIIFVMVLLAAGYPNKQIAETLGLTVPTLRKHYFHLLKQRDLMLDRIRTKLRVTQIQQGLAGNNSALTAALKMLDTVNVERAQKKVNERSAPAKQEAPKKLGKKEEQKIAAQNVGGKFAPPAAPKLVIDNR